MWLCHLPTGSLRCWHNRTHSHICTLQMLTTSFHWFWLIFLHAHILENPPCMAVRDVTHGCFVCVSHMKISPHRSILSRPQQPVGGLPVSKARLLFLCTVESWSFFFFSFCSRCCFFALIPPRQCWHEREATGCLKGQPHSPRRRSTGNAEWLLPSSVFHTGRCSQQPTPKVEVVSRQSKRFGLGLRCWLWSISVLFTVAV